MKEFMTICKYVICITLAFLLVDCGKDSDDILDNEIVLPVENTGQEEPKDTVISEDPQETDLLYDVKYYVGELSIVTENGASITSKDNYVNATISMKHVNGEWEFSDKAAGIRGRGNSTWLWYPKKPYRIKFDKKQEMLGLTEAKSWVLLAEYRDPTSLMNAFVFELGQLMGMPYTNHNRYVMLTLNGKEQGLYHLTEQVQQNKARVNIDEKNGYLIQLDADDGPSLSPNATDNFWSEYYKMPVCVKNPDEPTVEVIQAVKKSLGELENAIAISDYQEVQSLLNVDSMIDFVMIQELIYNVELDAPRSMYMYKDIDGIWTMGPLWDFDAGFDFDWNNMERSHNYFSSFKELVLGTNPVSHEGTNYSVPGFFSDLFKMKEFASAYKKRWKEVRPLVATAMDEAEIFYLANTDSWDKDSELWPIGKQPSTQISSMRNWLNNRCVYLENIIMSYPDPK